MGIMGVLQRLGISYFSIATMTLLNARFVQRANINVLSKRTTSDYRRRIGDQFVDLVPFVAEWLIMSLVVAAWVLITFLVNIDGCPRGYVGPGGMQRSDDPGVDLHNCT